MSHVNVLINDQTDLFTIQADRCSNLVVNGKSESLPFTQSSPGIIQFSMNIEDLSIVNPDGVSYIKNKAGNATYICFESYVGKTMYGVATKIDALLREAQATTTTFSQGGLTGTFAVSD
jgi:hypothetical protein